MPDAVPLIVGFLKVRNEIVKCGNLYRVLYNMQEYCDDIFVVDDASWDGTYEYLKSQLPVDHIIRVPPEQHDFSNELFWKQKLLELVHKNGPYGWILWMDADEVLDANGTQGIRDFCREKLGSPEASWSFHYTQLWRNASWARTDSGFDDGWFIKLWKWTPNLSFDVRAGTHHMQFPIQAFTRVGKTPFEVIHYGNYGVDLRWKCLQYYGGLGGVDRHLRFESAQYRPLLPGTLPPGVDQVPSETPPGPFTPEQIQRILDLKNLKNLEKTFCVIIPTYNRAYSLPRALDSLLEQTYDKWICFVLDDGSNDNTPEILWEYQERDPRIFYCRYFDRRGGVAMNEIGMEVATRTAEWWTRLGSDDWFFADKLKMDAAALATHDAVYGPFVVHREGVIQEIGNYPVDPEIMVPIFLKGGFFASWANCAVRSSVLRQVKEKYVNYCDPSLQNMEDRLFNFRVAKLTNWVFRGMIGDQFELNLSPERVKEVMEDARQMSLVRPDAVWNANVKDGSSANMTIYGRDTEITTQIIAKEKDL